MKENDIEEGFWVFVSHSTKDFERVRLVRNALEDSGFRPILFYLKCLENETEVNDLLKREIDARKRFILCDSPNAQASKFVQSEVDYIRSKNRMYEIIDISQIDMNSQDAETEVLELIKPFKRRTKIFINNDHKDSKISSIVKTTFEAEGFSVVDSTSIFYDAWDNIPGGSATWADDVDRLSRIFFKSEIVSTLNEGYFVSLISTTSIKNDLQLFEIEQAFDIDSSRVFPVIINDVKLDVLPISLQKKNILNVSEIQSDEEKAKVIVDELIALDLRNQNNTL